MREEEKEKKEEVEGGREEGKGQKSGRKRRPDF